MKITDCTSPTFNGIKIQTSKMDWEQKSVCYKLKDAIKFSDRYSKLTDGGADVDIYMLPVMEGVEVRLVDLYSENFIKHKNGKIFRTVLDENDSLDKVAGKILNMYENIKNGIIKRPNGTFDDYIKGNTDVARINPEAHEAEWFIKFDMNGGATRAEAEKFAYEDHMNTVREYNKDDEF